MNSILNQLKSKKWYVVGIIVVLILITVIVIGNKPQSPIPNSINEVTQTGASEEEGESVNNNQLITLEELSPYQNEYFSIEETDAVPMFKVTLLQKYDASKQNFIDWLIAHDLDKLHMSQFSFVVKE